MQRTRREKEERGKSKDSNPFITINLSMPVSTPTVKPPTRSATGKMDDNMKSKGFSKPNCKVLLSNTAPQPMSRFNGKKKKETKNKN
jgi:hypothetical protein